MMKNMARSTVVTLTESCIENPGLATKPAYALCITILLVLLSGCGGSVESDSCGACTASFDFVFLSVKDQSGSPVTDATITVKIKATQEILAIRQDVYFTSQGLYAVLDDSFKNSITTDAAGDTLVVTGSSQGRNFTVEIVVNADPCRCHVQKVSGPSTITL